MADNNRWRNEQERYGYRDDPRERWRGEGRSQDYGRGGRSGDYRGGGYGGEDWRGDERGRYQPDQGSDEGYIAQRGFGNERAGYDRGQDRSGRYGENQGGYGGDYGQGGRYGGYQRGGGSRGGGSWSEDYGRGFRDEYRRDFGEGRGDSYGSDYRGGGYAYEGGFGGYGREGYGRGSGEYGRRGEERGFWDRASDEVSSWFGDDDAERRRRMDEGRGEHRGRGPKSYTRSDDRIREDVCDRLTDDPQVDASEIDVKVSSCEVTLSGTVHSREAKRRAEDCAERVSGVKHVQNNLRVQQQGTTGGGAAHTTGAGTTTGTQAATTASTTGARQKA